MCMACQEMELYYAYLDAIEEAKRKAQPWQCEVTLIPAHDEAVPEGAAAPTPAPTVAAKGKAGFVCDDPE
jgi:hypothetical protein